MNSKRKRWVGLSIVALMLLLCVSTPFQQFASFPNQLRIFQGSSVQELRLNFPAMAQISSSHPDVIKVNGKSTGKIDVNLRNPISVQSDQVGETELNLKLFGLLPFKNVKVAVYPELKVIPGGQSIGVKLKSDGVLVVGHYLLTKGNGKVSPGEEASIQIGDRIVEINGQKVKDISEVSEWVQKAGEENKPLKFTVIRDKETKTMDIRPLLDKKDKAYRIGLYIRDSAAGVGTLTFYDPKHQVYGALGHVISDMDTQKPIVVANGQIVYSNVNSIQKGTNGSPGEKHATLFDKDIIGNITKNTPFGIFGQMKEAPTNGLENEALPIAFSEEVKEGPAQILTVIDGQKVEKFNIEIVNVVPQRFPETKGMIIKITDPRLLKKTGGIIQGMSGSPILQNGKLIGAVTHVFVNDPTSGYGSYIEWMLQDAGIDLSKYRSQGSKAS